MAHIHGYESAGNIGNVEKPRRHFELPNWYLKFGVAELFKMYQELTK